MILLLFSAGPVALAQEESQPDPLSKGTWTLELSGSLVQHIRFSENTFYTAQIAGGYYLFDGFSVNGELIGAAVDQPGGGDEDAILGGVGLLLRWHALRFDHDAVTVFIDGGGDATYSDPEVPEFGTHFNWIGKVGIGASFRIKDDVYLIGGARYFHLSNGDIHGRDQNPSFDGVQYWLGMMVTF